MKITTPIIISFLLIIVSDILLYIGWTESGPEWVTYAIIPLQYFALFTLIYITFHTKWKHLIPPSIYLLFKIIILWNIFTIIRGVFFVNDYFDWKFILGTSLLFLLIPLAMVIGIHLTFAKKIFPITLKYLFIFGFALLPLALITNIQLYARIMTPVSIFLILSPFLKTKWKILIFLVAAVSIVSAISFRANFVRILAALLLLASYHFRSYIKLKLLGFLHVILFLTPIILLYLGVSGQFNIFNLDLNDENYEITDRAGQTRNMFVDSRTILYVEVFNSLVKNENLVLGEGAIGKYESDDFDFGDNRGRYMSEVGFLNTILFSGIIGLIIFLVFLYRVSYIAIFQSNNWLTKMFGLFIAFRWILFFAEEFTLFDLNFFFYWLIIGLICNNEFRSMTDLEISDYFKTI